MSAPGQRCPRPLPRPQPVRVTRSRRSTVWAAIGAVVVIAVLAYLPYLVYSGHHQPAGQLLHPADHGQHVEPAGRLCRAGLGRPAGLHRPRLVLRAHRRPARHQPRSSACPSPRSAAGVAGLVVWWLLSRLRSGYFAIATWVIASICYLVIIRFPSLGGGTGEPLPGLPDVSATLLDAYIYWIALGVTVDHPGRRLRCCCAAGSASSLTALRDDETGARSVGARVSRAQLLVFVVAAVGCGAAGGLELISQPFVQPNAAFSVQWTAEMIFACLIGGIGTIEGPIVGTIVFFALQQWLSNYGTWYFIVLGAVAIAVAIWAPRGLWGFISERFHIRLFPVGYWLWPADQQARPGLAAAVRPPGRRRLRP